jgi:hypothetical protein
VISNSPWGWFCFGKRRRDGKIRERKVDEKEIRGGRVQMGLSRVTHVSALRDGHEIKACHEL